MIVYVYTLHICNLNPPVDSVNVVLRLGDGWSSLTHEVTSDAINHRRGYGIFMAYLWHIYGIFMGHGNMM